MKTWSSAGPQRARSADSHARANLPRSRHRRASQRPAAVGGKAPACGEKASAGSCEGDVTDWTVTSSMPDTSPGVEYEGRRQAEEASWRARSCRACHEGQRQMVALLVAGLRTGGRSKAPSRRASGNGCRQTASSRDVGTGDFVRESSNSGVRRLAARRA